MGAFLGTIPNGDTIKLSNGGELNGPATLPAAISLCNLSVTMFGWSLALSKFGDSKLDLKLE